MDPKRLHLILFEIQRWETERAYCEPDQLDHAEQRLEEAQRALADMLCGDENRNMPHIPLFWEARA